MPREFRQNVNTFSKCLCREAERLVKRSFKTGVKQVIQSTDVRAVVYKYTLSSYLEPHSHTTNDPETDGPAETKGPESAEMPDVNPTASVSGVIVARVSNSIENPVIEVSQEKQQENLLDEKWFQLTPEEKDIAISFVKFIDEH